MPHPFQGPSYTTNSGDTIETMAVTAQDRLDMVKRMDVDSLLDVLMLDDLQTTVRKAAEARLRRLYHKSAIHYAQNDQEHSQ